MQTMSSNRTPRPPEHQTAASRKIGASTQGQPQQPAPTIPPMTESDRVGDILRRVREHRGEDLEVISDYLRIRPDYLFALENSHYEKLPADAYVIGFLRTYAAYLGLDGRGAIDQYRREMAGRRRKPQLSMPQPMSEGRAPTVVILVAAAVAFLILYGIWYGLSTPDEAVVSKPLPLSEVTTPDQPAAEQAADAISLTTPPAPENAGDAAKASEPAPTDTPQPAKAEGMNKDQPAKAEPVKAEPAKAEPVKAEPVKVEPIKVEPAKPEPAKTEAPKADATKTEAPKTEAPAPVDDSKSFGDKTKSRVSISADKDSWVLVTDTKGITVFERTLKAGEIYNVPSDRALNLTTGNVAGVRISIDGKEMPRLPATGKVARGVPLDAEKLRSRLTAPLPAQPAGGSPAAKTSPEKADKTDSGEQTD